ncbi:hypothetical protein ASF08_23230 [Methylobacterium sp. Leaf85]|nr:hypothetical protein ASF08_23230 [Methylobacterium sp. Leaf85]
MGISNEPSFSQGSERALSRVDLKSRKLFLTQRMPIVRSSIVQEPSRFYLKGSSILMLSMRMMPH